MKYKAQKAHPTGEFVIAISNGCRTLLHLTSNFVTVVRKTVRYCAPFLNLCKCFMFDVRLWYGDRDTTINYYSLEIIIETSHLMRQKHLVHKRKCTCSRDTMLCSTPACFFCAYIEASTQCHIFNIDVSP